MFNEENKSYDLYKLCDSPIWNTRYRIARNGYCLEKLINDRSKFVRDMVIEYCENHLDNDECRSLLLLNKLN